MSITMFLSFLSYHRACRLDESLALSTHTHTVVCLSRLKDKVKPPVSEPYPVDERVCEVFAEVLPVGERQAAGAEDGVVAVREVRLVLAVNQKHIPETTRRKSLID